MSSAAAEPLRSPSPPPARYAGLGSACAHRAARASSGSGRLAASNRTVSATKSLSELVLNEQRRCAVGVEDAAAEQVLGRGHRVLALEVVAEVGLENVLDRRWQGWR